MLLPYVKDIGGVNKATVPGQEKRDLLNQICQAAGAGVLLEVGQGVRQGDYDPIWQAALKALNPQHLMQGWQRLEAYAHSTNRLKLLSLDDHCARFERYAVNASAPPSKAENLLICGIVIALLEEIGCHGLRCRMPLKSGEEYTIYAKGVASTPDRDAETLETSEWTIEWREFREKQPAGDAADDVAYFDMPPDCNSVTKRIFAAAVHLLKSDFVRQWKVSELARELGLSTRGFQRHLQSTNLNFSRLIRYLRVREACRLIEAGTETFSVVGFCAGFSDSAHFSRDFRASLGMTPTDFKKAISDN